MILRPLTLILHKSQQNGLGVMNQVPLIFPKLGAVGVVEQVMCGFLGQVMLSLATKGVAEVKSAPETGLFILTLCCVPCRG